MPIKDELLNDIETELFSEMEHDHLETSKVCDKCGNQPCTCNKSDKACPECGKIPCQCNKSHKSNNSKQDTNMPLFDDPELNSLFADEHKPGEGADAGKEAEDPTITKGQMEGELSKRKKCKSIEEELFAKEGEDDGEANAEDTVNGDEVEPTKKGKKHKSDIADLFSDELFAEKKKAEDDGEGEDDGEDDGEGDEADDEDEDIEGSEAAEFELDIASEEATLDFDL